jgi:signal transduction histidine kinase
MSGRRPRSGDYHAEINSLARDKMHGRPKEQKVLIKRLSAPIVRIIELLTRDLRTMRKKTFLFQYGMSALAFGLALLLTHLLWPLIEPSASTLFFAAIMIAAFYGGLGPGLLVSALSALAIDYYFVPPFRGFELSVANTVRAGVFMLVAMMTSWLNASRKRLMEDIRERNSEREKLLTQISGFNDELRNEIAVATEELSTTNDSLLQTQQRLTRSERMAVVGQMAASLAHEIGTPLNAISGHMELLASNHPDDTDTQRRIHIISKQLDFIVTTVKRLLERTHERRILFQPIDLNSLVREVLSLVAPTLDKQSIVHEVRFQDDLPSLYADRDGLQQVLLNLINNSVDAMPQGGQLSITTSADHQVGSAEVIIKDTGIGIDQDTLDHLFEPMWTTKTSGSGFGLAIAHQIMIETGGQIEVVGGTEPGTTFRLTLPLRSAEPPQIVNEEVIINVA